MAVIKRELIWSLDKLLELASEESKTSAIIPDSVWELFKETEQKGRERR